MTSRPRSEIDAAIDALVESHRVIGLDRKTAAKQRAARTRLSSLLADKDREIAGSPCPRPACKRLRERMEILEARIRELEAS